MCSVMRSAASDRRIRPSIDLDTRRSDSGHQGANSLSDYFRLLWMTKSSSRCSGTDEPWGCKVSVGLLGSRWPHVQNGRPTLFQNLNCQENTEWVCVPVKIFFLNSSPTLLLIISHLPQARNTQFCITSSPPQLWCCKVKINDLQMKTRLVLLAQ